MLPPNIYNQNVTSFAATHAKTHMFLSLAITTLFANPSFLKSIDIYKFVNYMNYMKFKI